MFKNRSIMDMVISFFSLVPMILYTIVAILLTIIASSLSGTHSS